MLQQTNVSCALTFLGSQTQGPVCVQSQNLEQLMSSLNYKGKTEKDFGIYVEGSRQLLNRDEETGV